jgi:hypothetical protein
MPSCSRAKRSSGCAKRSATRTKGLAWWTEALDAPAYGNVRRSAGPVRRAVWRTRQNACPEGFGAQRVPLFGIPQSGTGAALAQTPFRSGGVTCIQGGIQPRLRWRTR